VGIRLMCFPATDVTFGDLVSKAFDAAGPGRAPQDLQAALRPTYPHVVAKAQDATAALGFDERWYVYRDGRLRSGPGDSWWEDSGLPQVVVDETNHYTAANDPACALLGVAPGQLVGRSWEEFASSATAEAADALRQSLQRFGHGDSTFRLTRTDGSILDIDYHTTVYVSGASVLYETVMRERPADD